MSIWLWVTEIYAICCDFLSEGWFWYLIPGEVVLHYVFYCFLVSRLIAPISLWGRQREVIRPPEQTDTHSFKAKSNGDEVSSSQTFPTPVSGSSMGWLLPKGWGVKCSMAGRVGSSAARGHSTMVWGRWAEWWQWQLLLTVWWLLGKDKATSEI